MYELLLSFEIRPTKIVWYQKNTLRLWIYLDPPPVLLIYLQQFLKFLKLDIVSLNIYETVTRYMVTLEITKIRPGESHTHTEYDIV